MRNTGRLEGAARPLRWAAGPGQVAVARDPVSAWVGQDPVLVEGRGSGTSGPPAREAALASAGSRPRNRQLGTQRSL